MCFAMPREGSSISTGMINVKQSTYIRSVVHPVCLDDKFLNLLVLDVRRHREGVAGYNDKSNQDRPTTGQVCLSWGSCGTSVGVQQST